MSTIDEVELVLRGMADPPVPSDMLQRALRTRRARALQGADPRLPWVLDSDEIVDAMLARDRAGKYVFISVSDYGPEHPPLLKGEVGQFLGMPVVVQ